MVSVEPFLSYLFPPPSCAQHTVSNTLRTYKSMAFCDFHVTKSKKLATHRLGQLCASAGP